MAKPVSGETAEDANLNVMRLYCNRTKKADSHGVVRDGPPLRSLVAVEILRHCPKFNGIPSTTTTTDVIDTGNDLRTTQSKERQLPRKRTLSSPSKHKPRGVKHTKQSNERKVMDNGLCSLADAMRLKNEIKKKELRLKCISQLPDGPEKTSLLMEFLNPNKSIGESGVVDDNDVASVEPENKLSILDLINIPDSST